MEHSFVDLLVHEVRQTCASHRPFPMAFAQFIPLLNDSKSKTFVCFVVGKVRSDCD